jgi:transposase
MELRMSRPERSWLKYLAAYESGTAGLTQEQIAGLMNCTVRTVARRLDRYRSEGDAGLVHRARGRPSRRRLPEAVRQQALALVAEHYADFGPTLAAEKLLERHHLGLSRESLRRLMIGAGLWQPRARQVKHRRWRQRRACVGELVQVDTSIHDWFEGRGPQVVLISLIDDATGRVFRRFYPTDSTVTNMTHLRDYLARYGRPLALYGDGASHFLTTRQPTVDEQLAAQPPLTQIGRALRELDIAWIPAHSPQAKGRIERSFQTAQDRLVKELRLAGISDLATANGFLEEYDQRVTNQRFAIAPAGELDAHRPLDGYDLQAILSLQEERTITRDYCLQFDRQRYQIPRAAARPGMVGSKVIVEQRLDGSRHFRWRDQYLPCLPTPAPPAAGAAGTPAVGLRPPSAAPARPAPPTPKPDHPWRRNLQGAFRSQRQ